LPASATAEQIDEELRKQIRKQAAAKMMQLANDAMRATAMSPKAPTTLTKDCEVPESRLVTRHFSIRDAVFADTSRKRYALACELKDAPDCGIHYFGNGDSETVWFPTGKALEEALAAFVAK